MYMSATSQHASMAVTFRADGAYPPFMYTGSPAMAHAVGNFDGATVRLEVSPDGAHWSPIDEATYTENGATPMFMPATTMRWVCYGAGPGTLVNAVVY